MLAATDHIFVFHFLGAGAILVVLVVLGAHPGMGEELIQVWVRSSHVSSDTQCGEWEGAGTSNGVQGGAGDWRYYGKGIGERWKKGNEM